jgi:wyosine [tRNA(Phe)-imidazoG37] synthetase (radical SAM superfamily)
LLAKKLGYTVMVTTNASIIQFESKSKEYLPTIDQLIISIPIINEQKQLLINGTKGVINFDKVFENIRKYWN